jgi:hypothetical protein
MAAGSTQPLTRMSTRNLPEGKGQPACKADNFTAICDPAVSKIWEPQSSTTPRPSMACYRDTFTFYKHIYKKFWEELIIYFPFSVMLLSDMTSRKKNFTMHV